VLLNELHLIRLLVACLLCQYCWLVGARGQAYGQSQSDWQRTDLAKQQFLINGTGARHNPLRRSLKSENYLDQIYVRFAFQYRAICIDDPETGNGEFFVLWFDSQEGNDQSPHANHVPNLGLHTDGKTNRFMIRFDSSKQVFAKELVGDKWYDMVGRLSKSELGVNQPFDTLEMWIDPRSDSAIEPDIRVKSDQSIRQINWIGFSTGGKTEIGDEIVISDFRIAKSWGEIMDLSSIDPRSDAYNSKITREKINQTVSFKNDVLPILKSNCFECHDESDDDTKVRLDQFDHVLNQVIPYDAESSELYRLISESKMPPGDASLNSRERKIIESWINEGLDWDEELLPDSIPVSDHWAFQALVRPQIPSFEDANGFGSPIDAFITESQREIGIIANPIASPDQLERRRTLDMLGLPVAENREEQRSSVVSFLSDPAYGERWARHWLDVTRWAESNGYQHNRDRKYAWRYRDWVVEAFNHGLNYRDFVISQLAGDELQTADDDSLIATGYLASARYSGNELDKDIQRNDILNDITANVGATFLGLTVQCAQCHHHQFDPVSMRDYYRLQAFFTGGQPQNILLSNDLAVEVLANERDQLFDSVRRRIIRFRREQNYPEPIYVTPETIISQMRSGEKFRLNQIDNRLKQADQTWAFYAPQSAFKKLTVMPHEMRWPLSHDPTIVANYPARILIRGDVKTPGPGVESDWPKIFRTQDEFGNSKPKTRIDLAHWIVSDKNPLAARVWVNRLWQWHFGRGLVKSPNDFGLQGKKPTQPKLLDYLACELIDSNWDTNRIHRLILASDTYQRSSQLNSANQQLDPNNDTYWRWQPRRLESEVIRDSMLMLAGKLDKQIGGPSEDERSNRRSLYLKQKRDNFPQQQDLFDGPNGVVSCAKRQVSTNALQPLWLLNNHFVHEMADAFAVRAKSVERVIRLALNRDPTTIESQILTKLETEHGLASVCVVIFNSSEFLYMP